MDYFHIDIMDGRYVPNFAMSLYDLKYIAKATTKPEKLISHRLKFEDLKKGFELMRDKTEDYVKVMALL